MDNTTKTANKILKKSCSYITKKDGTPLKPEEVDTTQLQWFSKHSWTEKQQENFTKWLTTKLIKDINFRRLISAKPSDTSEAFNRRLAELFVFSYGWKLK
jgi:hypothetical protein